MLGKNPTNTNYLKGKIQCSISAYLMITYIVGRVLLFKGINTTIRGDVI